MKQETKRLIIGNVIGATIGLTIAFLVITLAQWSSERSYGHRDITYVQYVKECFKYLNELIHHLW